MALARSLAKQFQVEATPFDDALKCANRKRLGPMACHNHLSPIRMSPFLVTAALTGEDETVLLQNLPDLSRVADREPPAHGNASSNTLAPRGNATSAGSNQRANASFAFATASSSVSPALAHPGSSGNTADHLFTSESNSMTRRSFTVTA